MKKSISIALLFAITLVALSVSVSARYNYISQLSVGLTINSSSGLADCSGLVKPSSSGTRTELTISLQQYKNGGWSEIYSWSNSGIGMASVTKAGQRYVEKGTYKVVVTAKVYDSSTGSLLEDESYTSSEKTY